MSADARLDWRRRLRCHAALLNLTAKGGGRPFLVASLGAPGSAAAAMDVWVERKTKGDGKPMLQPGPDAALQLLRVLATSTSAGVVRALRDAEAVASGSAAHTLLDVLAETPGVVQVQHAGLATLWALLRLGSRSGTQLEKRLIDRGLFEHCEDEWEDSKEHEGVAHCIGGVVMQLAANGDDATRAEPDAVGRTGARLGRLRQTPGVVLQGRVRVAQAVVAGEAVIAPRAPRARERLRKRARAATPKRNYERNLLLYVYTTSRVASVRPFPRLPPLPRALRPPL
jgi:hypothetical protein